MKIVGLDGMDGQELRLELERGAKFVIFEYCISLLVITFKRTSNIYFVRSGDSVIVKGLGFSLISLFMGWWGFPWGPIYTISSFVTNFGGGIDVTRDVIENFKQGA